MAELLQADRKLWGELAAMHQDGWSLDEAQHEMTKVRSDTHALLQPRAKQVIVYKGNAAAGKGKAKTERAKAQRASSQRN